MAKSDKDKKLQKLKKLLALTKSSNPHEAANALKKAQAYAREHNISDIEVELADLGVESFTLNTKTPPNWVLCLARLVSDAFGCHPILGSELVVEKFTTKRTVRFIGVSPNQELAIYTFEVLYEQLRKARLAFVKAQPKQCKPSTKQGRGDAFAEEWCYAVQSKVQALVVSEEHQAMITRYTNEVVLGGAEAKTYTARDTTKGSKFNNARHEGYAAGKQAQLNTPVNGRCTPQLSDNR